MGRRTSKEFRGVRAKGLLGLRAYWGLLGFRIYECLGFVGFVGVSGCSGLGLT